jgi:hypothetical protein
LELEAEAIAASIRYQVETYGEYGPALVEVYAERVKGRWLTFGYGTVERWKEAIRRYL